MYIPSNTTRTVIIEPVSSSPRPRPLLFRCSTQLLGWDGNPYTWGTGFPLPLPLSPPVVEEAAAVVVAEEDRMGAAAVVEEEVVVVEKGVALMLEALGFGFGTKRRPPPTPFVFAVKLELKFKFIVSPNLDVATPDLAESSDTLTVTAGAVALRAGKVRPDGDADTDVVADTDVAANADARTGEDTPNVEVDLRSSRVRRRRIQTRTRIRRALATGSRAVLLRCAHLKMRVQCRGLRRHARVDVDVDIAVDVDADVEARGGGEDDECEAACRTTFQRGQGVEAGNYAQPVAIRPRRPSSPGRAASSTLTAWCAQGRSSHELGGVSKRVVGTGPGLNIELELNDADAAAAGVRDGTDAERRHARVERRVADNSGFRATPVGRDNSGSSRWVHSALSRLPGGEQPILHILGRILRTLRHQIHPHLHERRREARGPMREWDVGVEGVKFLLQYSCQPVVVQKRKPQHTHLGHEIRIRRARVHRRCPIMVQILLLCSGPVSRGEHAQHELAVEALDDFVAPREAKLPCTDNDARHGFVSAGRVRLVRAAMLGVKCSGQLVFAQGYDRCFTSEAPPSSSRLVGVSTAVSGSLGIRITSIQLGTGFTVCMGREIAQSEKLTGRNVPSAMYTIWRRIRACEAIERGRGGQN
ncbi:hypothetical protein B0H11DRAFT_1913000 [Mycena galericulata]|nr:hypothetical protein B0H11DRAFT_1913000 [Mycena galericulata]